MSKANFAACISEHPIPTTAVGEVAGHLLDHGGEYADLLCLFVSPHHAGALEDIAAAFHTLLDPKVMIGCAADAVIGPGREVEDGPAIAAWCGNVGDVEALRLEVVDHPNGGRAIGGWPSDPSSQNGPRGSAIVFTDSFSFPISALFDTLNRSDGSPLVTGGMASAARGPGGNRLVLNGEVFDSGAVGVLINVNNDVETEIVLSQGCRPVGSPYVVTRAQDNVIYELAGEPALTRLTATVREELSEEDAALAQDGLLIGRVIDEHKAEFSAGDFLIRTFIDADPLEGSVTIGERIEVGTTVQFHLRDAESAEDDLRTLLSSAPQTTEGALLFSCNGRGEGLYGEPDHDAGILIDTCGDIPVAGFFAAGEFGPTGGRNYVHGFSASLALFSTPQR